MDNEKELMLQVILQQQKAINERDARIVELTEQINDSNNAEKERIAERYVREINWLEAERSSFYEESQESTAPPSNDTRVGNILRVSHVGNTSVMVDATVEQRAERCCCGLSYWVICHNDTVVDVAKMQEENCDYDDEYYKSFNYFVSEKAAKAVADLFNHLIKYLPKE